ncbi:lectin [Pseudoalteromonas rubra]|uniref:Lectin n=1 Tax=Pseudoalteromonas rubra TaxID=43658 RepID=A0A4Q7E0E7_9GAMM|nr:lectin [Pseudoalteromonas rubra]RZM73329.1 lectin [Pseudoalteromonas rubra]
MTNTLTPGQSLSKTQSIRSNNNGYELVLQEDGNLVLYRTIDMKALWASGTNGKAASRVIMQGDGNLVLYGYENHCSNPLWSSNTADHPSSYLILQDDGNLVIYYPKDPTWSSNTAS